MRKDRVISEVLGQEFSFTPSDMCNQRFKRVLAGGYSPREVDAYLAKAADYLERALEQLRVIKEQCEEQRIRLEEYRQMEATLRSALISSQKFAEGIVEAARREADAMVGEARLRQAQALQEAAKLPETLAAEVKRLEEQRARLRAELLAVLETHRNLVERLAPECTGGPSDSWTQAPSQLKEEVHGPAPQCQSSADQRSRPDEIACGQAADAPEQSAETAADDANGDESLVSGRDRPHANLAAPAREREDES